MCNEMTHWGRIWLYLKADKMTMMPPCQHLKPNAPYLWNKHAISQQSTQAFHTNKSEKERWSTDAWNPAFWGINVNFLANAMFLFSFFKEYLEIISLIICLKVGSRLMHCCTCIRRYLHRVYTGGVMRAACYQSSSSCFSALSVFTQDAFRHSTEL